MIHKIGLSMYVSTYKCLKVIFVNILVLKIKEIVNIVHLFIIKVNTHNY